MKNLNIFITNWLLRAFILFSVLVISEQAMACEACNRMFLDGLLGKEKFNSLISQEARAAIQSQGTTGAINEKNRRWVNDVMAMNNYDYSNISEAHAAIATAAMASAMPVTPGAVASAAAQQAQSGEFFDIIRRDNNLSIPATSYVPQNTPPDKYVRITLEEGDTYIGNGVIYKGFTIDGKIPGPTIVVDEGDVVSFKIVNEGNIYHGASIHAVNSQTSKYLGKIQPGDSATVVFKANMPGVYMYHCAPGGHAIPMHIIFGQYGMIVVNPKKKYELEKVLGKEPDINLYLIQHEYYASGKDAVEGQGKPMYTAFNGKLNRYVEEPIVGRPGDYVRINFINLGPNLLSTFHIVGIIWDYAYWQGNPENRLMGGQSVTAGPSDSWVIEFRIPPDEGSYLMLSHAVGSTDRGALGLLVCDGNAEPRKQTILADGIKYTPEEMEEYRSKALRTVTPFGIGSPDVDVPVVHTDNTQEVIVRIIGNSYYPKVVQVTPGTTVKWINEDVFGFMDGEFSGIHNVFFKSGPERFGSELMAHAESYSFEFTKEGEYLYMCTPHPYMEGKIIVAGQSTSGTARVYAASSGPTNTSFYVWILLAIASLALAISIMALVKKGEQVNKVAVTNNQSSMNLD